MPYTRYDFAAYAPPQPHRSSDRALYRLAAGALAGSLLAAGLYAWWTGGGGGTGKPAKRGKGATVSGLHNLGRTCFANALVQALAASGHFARWLRRAAATPAGGGDGDGSGSFVAELHAVVEYVNRAGDEDDEEAPCDGEGKEAAGPRDSALTLMGSLERRRWRINHYAEQDMYELYNVFAAAWDEQLADSASASDSGGCGLNAVSELDADGACRATGGRSRAGGRLRRERAVRPACDGLLATQLQCRACGYKKLTCEVFNALSLPLAAKPLRDDSSPVPLELCLRRYFCIEKIRDATCDRCGPAERVDLVKRLALAKLPSCLVLRVERQAYVSDAAVKLCAAVACPPALDARQWALGALHGSAAELGAVFGFAPADAPQFAKLTKGAGGTSDATSSPRPNGMRRSVSQHVQRYLYALRAVCVHSGEDGGGHFACYRKPAAGGPWYYVSDSDVRRVPWEEVHSCQAYFVVYDRLEKDSDGGMLAL